MDISNGIGIGISIFIQGCHFHCKNCFNKSTWDFNSGYEWTEEKENNFIKLADKDYIKRISILGGEPLADENVIDVHKLIIKIRNTYKFDKQIWLYTGYDYDKIINKYIDDKFYTEKMNDYRYKVVNSIDVLVDGQYIENLKDIDYPFAGSTNQRVIDINKTKENNKIILLKVD